jgi:hypothetical protein
MSQAQGQGWGMGRRARRRGRLIEQLTPLPAGEGPDVPRLVHWGTEGTAVEPRVAAWERRLRALPRRIRRALQRHFALTLAELALLLALWQGPGWAATINVDGTTCTLADAITAANTDTATGGCPAGSGADTLVLPAFSTLTLTAVDNSTYGDNGLPVGSCPATDQRGFVRPSGVACDIGAVELGAQAPPVVTSQVSFVPLPDTFSTTTDATGCPGGFAGRFFFQAQLTNLGGSPPLAALKDVVAELTNGNLVQTADGGPAGVGSLQTVPEVEDLSDRVLEPTGTVTVPFVICLQSLNAFRFLVDVQGQELPPP